MNLGRYEARACRDGLEHALKTWRGPIAVIDGALSDELKWPSYHPLSKALANALRRAKRAGQLSHRQWGCDMDVGSGTATAVMIRKRLILKDDKVTLTGAWVGNADDQGCVNAAAEVLRRAGIATIIHESAFCEADQNEEEDDEE